VMTPNYFHPKTMFPANHFGVILEWEKWHSLKDRLLEEKIAFVVEPQKVFSSETGEQMTLMIKDDDGHIIEFKSFENIESVFKK
jgi:extradiol dioxygenase family protein